MLYNIYYITTYFPYANFYTYYAFKKSITDCVLDRRTILRYLDQTPLPLPTPTLLSTKDTVVITEIFLSLVIDGIYIGKDKDRVILLMARDTISGQVVYTKEVLHETKEVYVSCIETLIKQRYVVASITIDGRAGIAQALSVYAPVQLCQFHVQQAILRRTTRRPKIELGMKLKDIAQTFIKKKWNKHKFTEEITTLQIEFKDFLKERSDDNSYKHKQLRGVFLSLKRSLPYLFTYEEYKHTVIPNTTNSIDGGVNTKIRTLTRLHRGMRRDRMMKLIYYLLNTITKTKRSKNSKK